MVIERSDVSNAFLNLAYEPALESLGSEFYDPVAAASFPSHQLRFRNDLLLPKLGLDPQQVTDQEFIECFGLFVGVRPFLALRYHGHQIAGPTQSYNPDLGDGRGFLYGQVRGQDGELYDFGTKGSGQTPYSRRGDGRLTLKGGVREVLAAEALASFGVKTSRCLSLIETGEALWRGDEPSPTRSSVMIRFSRSHIRFGTFERLHYHQRTDLIQCLLDHVIEYYYPELEPGQYSQFYRVLVQRTAQLVAQWMVAGFCHGVLNTDNMSITGESFDYGPYGFIPTYNPRFVAAYFDYHGLYCYGNQPLICRHNLELLQLPLARVIPALEMKTALAEFEREYWHAYEQLLLRRLGLATPKPSLADLQRELLEMTLLCLEESQCSYPGFFSALTEGFNPSWRESADFILENSELGSADWGTWRRLYHRYLQALSPADMTEIAQTLAAANPPTALLRPVIELVWEAIDQEDNWQPFQQLVACLQTQQPFTLC
ncbi:hypothetical protein OLK001_28370 [Synechocystis sp. LKSZ1]